jgi:hypothetical protein
MKQYQKEKADMKRDKPKLYVHEALFERAAL